MNLADAAPQPDQLGGALGCAALVCLFVISAVALIVVLRRRNRRDGQSWSLPLGAPCAWPAAWLAAERGG